MWKSGKCLIKVDDLPAGTYYIVSEGNSENGFITINIEGLGADGPLSPTMGQPHVISYIPTVATDDVLSWVLMKSAMKFNITIISATLQ